MISEIKNNKNYILYSTLISFLTIVPQFIFFPPVYSFKHYILLIVVFVILVFISKFSKLLFSLAIIYLNATNILIGHIFIHWGYERADIQPRLDVAEISPRYETLEYLMTYIDYRDILLMLYSFSILYALYRFLVFYKHSFKVIKYLALITTVVVISLINKVADPFNKIEPYSIANKIIKAKEYAKLANERSTYLQTVKKKNVKKTNLIYDKIIFIQGEAVNKHHMSIYGYDQNTTPFFSSLVSNDNLYVFNAIAPTNGTRFSVPIMHTKANVHDFENAFIHSRSDVSIFKDYGYKTYWISNQGTAGEHDDSITSIGKEADTFYFPNLDFWKAKLDSVVVSYLNNIQKHTLKEMYVIHIVGSHGGYTSRYPKDIRLFKNPKDVYEEYDNTIYYTDYIIQQIYKYFMQKFKDQKILIFYVSDHGEIVSKSTIGHGFYPSKKDEYDVPFAIYSNVENERINRLKTLNVNQFNLENTNYIFEYISGLTDDLNISYSREIIAGDPKYILNYDTIKYYKEGEKLKRLTH